VDPMLTFLVGLCAALLWKIALDLDKIQRRR
jgi:hypothetical protein